MGENFCTLLKDGNKDHPKETSHTTSGVTGENKESRFSKEIPPPGKRAKKP